MTVRCLLALGSNLGDRRLLLRHATREVSSLPDCQLLARSRWHETTPIGGPGGQGSFLNGALLLQTAMQPQELVGELHAIESRLGRERAVRWDARPIDIDLLLYGRETIVSADLTVPHPRMSFRRFVLEPATEIAGDMCHPTSGWTVAQLLAHLVSAPPIVAVASVDPSLAKWLSDALQAVFAAPRSQSAKRAGDVERSAGIEFFQWSALNPGATTPPAEGGGWSPPGGRLTAQTDGRALLIALEPDSLEIFWKKIKQKKFAGGPDLPTVAAFAFREILDQHGHGPMARIQTDDPSVALEEAIAAVTSCWPELVVENVE